MNVTSLDDLRDIIKDLCYKDGWSFRIGEMGDGFFLQLKFYAQDLITKNLEIQSGRKWYISKYMTKSEIVQTSFLACLKAEEHECREQFTYCGEQIYCPHYSVDELLDFTKKSSRDKRQ